MEDKQQPGISVADIAGVVQLIDVVTARGAIRGEELTQVGELRQRFVTFVEHVKSQQKQENQEEKTETSE